MIGYGKIKRIEEDVDKINDCNDKIAVLLKDNLRLIEEMNQFIDKLEKHIKEV